MFPILFRTEFGFIFTLTAVWGVGILLGVAWLWTRPRAELRDPFQPILSGLLLAGFAGLILGRVGFVWREWAYFTDHRSEIWRLDFGGASYAWVILGIYFAWFLYSHLALGSGWVWATRVAPLVLWFHFVGWSACYLEGCAAGRVSTIGWLTAELPDQFGVMSVRYQTQLAGALLSLLLLGLLAVSDRALWRVLVGWVAPLFGSLLILWAWTS